MSAVVSDPPAQRPHLDGLFISERQTSGVPVGVPFTTISAGQNRTCGLRSSDGTPTCWGGRVHDPR